MSDSKFITGLILGAIGGVLLAPASGKETREKITDATADIRASLKEKIEVLRKEYTDKGELTIEGVKHALSSGGSDDVLQELSSLENKIEKKYEELDKEAQELLAAFKQKNSLT